MVSSTLDILCYNRHIDYFFMPNSAAFFGASLDEYAPTIDLHTTTNITDAINMLDRGLYREFQNEATYVRIIHGIGEGKLAKAVHDALEANPMVRDWKQEEHGGATIALL